MDPRSLEPEYRFHPPKPSRFWDLVLRPFHVHRLRRRLLIRELEIQGGGQVQELRAQGGRLLITPNHPAHGDPEVICEATRRLGMHCNYMATSDLFHGLHGWALQHMGAFSVDREGSDLQAFKQAVTTLVDGLRPLVIFPEGEIYHLNDRVTPLREGVAVIALSAARRKGDADHAEPGAAAEPAAAHPLRVYCVPCAIKYFYLEDPAPALLQAMSQLEERIHWRPQTDLPLPERIYRYAEAVLALKELEFTRQVSTGRLPERIGRLMEQVLQSLETRHGVGPDRGTVPERLKELRRRCFDAMEDLEPAAATPQLIRDFQDIHFVAQLFSYPGDYVAERPTIERMTETIQKFQEDALERHKALPTHPRKAVVRFGQAIEVGEFIDQATKPADGADLRLQPRRRMGGAARKLAGRLTELLQSRIQALLDEINAAAPARM